MCVRMSALAIEYSANSPEHGIRAFISYDGSTATASTAARPPPPPVVRRSSRPQHVCSIIEHLAQKRYALPLSRHVFEQVIRRPECFPMRITNTAPETTRRLRWPCAALSGKCKTCFAVIAYAGTCMRWPAPPACVRACGPSVPQLVTQTTESHSTFVHWLTHADADVLAVNRCRKTVRTNAHI